MEGSNNGKLNLAQFLIDIHGWIEWLVRSAIVAGILAAWLQIEDLRLASAAALGTEYSNMTESAKAGPSARSVR